jgi:peptidoglycan/xylan/chitin deacetylase (PgdA/CDA1 family)
MLAAPIAGASCASAFLAWAVRGRSSSVFGPSVWHGDPTRPAIALTFDDGPSESTSQLLDILSHEAVPATFFQIGANVSRLPSIACEVAARGHVIGNHSHTHPLLCRHSPAFIQTDLRRAQDAIQTHTGVTPAWFRAPYGARWFGLRPALRRLALTDVMWTSIGYDWKCDADTVVARVTHRISGGSILCLHDGRELHSNPDISATLGAVRRLIPLLRDRGFSFETVTRLLCQTT